MASKIAWIVFMPLPELRGLQVISLKINISFKHINKQALLRDWEGEVVAPGSWPCR